MSAAFLVADSGPLIALARLDLLDLPARYFESVLVTSTVWEEVTRKPDIDETPRLSAAAEGRLIRVAADPETTPATLLRTTIDTGERAAIALALELDATLLMDDRRARRVAIEAGAASCWHPCIAVPGAGRGNCSCAPPTNGTFAGDGLLHA